MIGFKPGIFVVGSDRSTTAPQPLPKKKLFFLSVIKVSDFAHF